MKALALVAVLTVAVSTGLYAQEGIPAEPPAEMNPAPIFLRGDVNRDGGVDVSDGSAILSYLFAGGAAPSCPKAADADDDGAVGMSDALHVFSYLFSGGAPVASPFPLQGADLTADDLECPVGESGVPRLYEIHDNGIRCIVGPCPSWTVSRPGEESQVTDVDLSLLGVEDEAQTLAELAAGEWLIEGVILEGPGSGLTIRVHQLLSPDESPF